jgi:hypothetical protein
MMRAEHRRLPFTIQQRLRPSHLFNVLVSRLLDEVLDLAARAGLILYRFGDASSNLVQGIAKDFPHETERNGVA